MRIGQLIREAEARIGPHVRRTPLEYSPYLSQASGAEVYLKCENLQITGSFKLRGALNRVLAMSAHQRRRGVVAASTGNHGKAVAYALHKLEVPGTVFVPRDTSPTKVAAIERYGVEVCLEASDPATTEARARRHAQQHAMTYVSPYNDPLVVAGQGTLGLEIEQDLSSTMNGLFVAVGGGGLLSGVAGGLKVRHPELQVYGCSPANSAVMLQSLRAGTIVELPSCPTLSEGTAGGIEPGSLTLELCRRWCDHRVTVTEAEIAWGLREFIATHSQLIEGAAAVALAGFWKRRRQWRGKKVVVVLCGANISVDVLAEVLRA